MWEEKDPGASAGLRVWLSAYHRLVEALNDGMQTLKGPYYVKLILLRHHNNNMHL